MSTLTLTNGEALTAHAALHKSGGIDFEVFTNFGVRFAVECTNDAPPAIRAYLISSCCGLLHQALLLDRLLAVHGEKRLCAICSHQLKNTENRVWLLAGGPCFGEDEIPEFFDQLKIQIQENVDPLAATVALYSILNTIATNAIEIAAHVKARKSQRLELP